MRQRFKDWFIAVLRSVNILACTLIFGSLYIFDKADKPSGRMMISCYVGRALTNGHGWAVPVAGFIDTLFGKDHCVRAYRHYRGLDGT